MEIVYVFLWALSTPNSSLVNPVIIILFIICVLSIFAIPKLKRKKTIFLIVIF